MKHIYTSILFLGLADFLPAQTVNTTGSNTFSPDLITINLGQSVTFNVGSGHTATEVSEATWLANSDISNGGFNYAPGTHVFTPTTPGTYYYVCIPHSSMGMKGRVVVDSGTGINGTGNTTSARLFPNPTTDALRVEGAPTGARIVLLDAQGREVLAERVNSSSLLDFRHLPAGTYVARLIDATGTLRLQERITLVR